MTRGGTGLRRSRTTVAATVSAIAALTLLLAACGADPPGPPPSSLGARGTRVVPDAVRNIVFTTSTGERVSLNDFRGKVVVLTDFLTLCGEECPMTSANMNQMARTITKDGLADKVVFLEFSVDPQRDTPMRLAAYRALFGKAANWVLLTTTLSSLATFAKFFGIFYERTKEGSPPDIDWLNHQPLTYDVAHQDALVFLDTKGNEQFVILGNADTAGKKPPETLSGFLDEQGETNLASPGPLSWTVPRALSVVSWLLGSPVKT